MKIYIRTARREDTERIVELRCLLADYHANFDKIFASGKEVKKGFKNYLRELMRKRNAKIYVAEVEGKIVGYAIGRITSHPALRGRIGKITDIFVLENYRRIGIGNALVKELLKWFKKKNVKNIILSVATANKTGLKFWKKQGFKEFLITMRKKI